MYLPQIRTISASCQSYHILVVNLFVKASNWLTVIFHSQALSLHPDFSNILKIFTNLLTAHIIIIIIYWYMAAKGWSSKHTIKNKHTRKV